MADLSTKLTMKAVVGFVVFCSFTAFNLLVDGIPVAELKEQERPKGNNFFNGMFLGVLITT